VTSQEDLVKIGDFARLAHTNLRTLRYYEEIGLLQPALRSDGGFRYFRQTDLNRVKMIRDLQDLGLQLETIGELLSTRESLGDRKAWLDKVARALREQEQLIDQRVESLQAQKGQISEALTKLVECGPCIYCPGAENNYCEPCESTGIALPRFLSALF
jgi:DNA-binding transcriptional MerR regulator